MRTPEYFILALFIVTGLFSLISSIFNFDWYFQSKKAETFVKLLGRNGARVFYALLGLALIGCGIMGFVSWK